MKTATIASGNATGMTVRTATPQIEQRVYNNLTGTMIGNLSTAVDLHNRNTAGIGEYMFAPTGLTQREHRSVL